VNRTTTDVEQLVRRTFAGVAARTTIGAAAAPSEVRLATVPPVRSHGRWRSLAAAAAVAAVVVGGLVVLVGRDASAPSDESDLVHALAARVPQEPLAQGGSVALPITEIVSTGRLDRLTWSADGISVSLIVERGTGTEPATGVRTTIRGSTTAFRTERTDGGELRWIERPGVGVTVRWSGDVDKALVDDTVAGIFFVDDDTWRRAIDRAGFAAFGEPLLEGTMTLGDRTDVELRGNIAEGYDIGIGPYGHDLPVADCSAVFEMMPSSGPDGPTRYLVLGPRGAVAAQVTVVGRPPVTVDLVPAFRGLDLTIGIAEFDPPPPSDLPAATCREASS
jgi:hypothetical protein